MLCVGSGGNVGSGLGDANKMCGMFMAGREEVVCAYRRCPRADNELLKLSHNYVEKLLSASPFHRPGKGHEQLLAPT